MNVPQQQGKGQSDPHAGLHGMLTQHQTVLAAGFVTSGTEMLLSPDRLRTSCDPKLPNVPVVASLFGTSPCMMPASAGVQVVAAEWQGSRGDTRLLARLGLSQAGLQDEKDAQEKALAAKNRWRRKSSTKGRCSTQVADVDCH